MLKDGFIFFLLLWASASPEVQPSSDGGLPQVQGQVVMLASSDQAQLQRRKVMLARSSEQSVLIVLGQHTHQSQSLLDIPGAEHPFAMESCSVAQAEVQWHNPGSLKPPLPASPVAKIIGMCHHTQMIFVFLVDEILPCWPGWSRIPDLVIHLPRPPKVPVLSLLHLAALHTSSEECEPSPPLVPPSETVTRHTPSSALAVLSVAFCRVGKRQASFTAVTTLLQQPGLPSSPSPQVCLFSPASPS
ncbi:hypothetical protein AAY473_000170 [Plecturocebus cupreus]